MNRIIAVLILFCAVSFFGPLAASAITIPTVPVGNPGNPSDPTTGLGSVAYSYRIGTTEITNSQYAEFLNAKAASDPLRLFTDAQEFLPYGGIIQSGPAGSFTYAVKPIMGDRPVNLVNFYQAIRFVNWLQNGQGNGDTESGSYTLLGGTVVPSNASSITREAGATWFLPNENEWYKAAYYQPASQGGDTDNYWLYATRSNNAPTIVHEDGNYVVDNPGFNVANYHHGGRLPNPPQPNIFGGHTPVSSFGPLSTSYYGTYDQSGNLIEWNERSFSNGAKRGQRGGGWSDDTAINLSSAFSTTEFTGVAGTDLGFRVAMVPEPSSFVLAALGLIGLAAWGWRGGGERPRRNSCCTTLVM